MSRSGVYPAELRMRAVRMVAEVRPNYDSDYAAITAVANKLGTSPFSYNLCQNHFHRPRAAVSGQRPARSTRRRPAVPSGVKSWTMW
jgi:hypothetical protein